MKIIKPTFEILTQLDGEAILKHIEMCGRTCYQSEAAITDDSYKRFVENIINRGHEPMMTVRLTWPPQEGFVLSVKKRFNRIYKKDWFNSDLAEQMVLDIDDTEHIKDATFESPVLGTIPAQMLSGGVKALLMILNQDKIHTYSSTIFGGQLFTLAS